MTDEERKKLLRKLYDESTWPPDTFTCHQAAREIERLANRVAELEAMPPDNARWTIHDNHWTRSDD